jgi:hypothetical protein
MMTTINGRAQRKTLASQLDRLDGILDALSQGLQEAVAGVVQQAVSQAVGDAVRAVLTDPELLRRLAATTAPVADPAPQATPVPQQAPTSTVKRSRLGAAWLGACAALGAGWHWAGRVAGRVRAWSGVRLRATVEALSGPLGCAWRWLAGVAELAWLARRSLLLATAVGLVLGVTVYLAGPWAAAAAGWLAGFVTTAAVQAGLALRRLFAGDVHLNA